MADCANLPRLNILVLYGANATFTSTVIEHLQSYTRHSRHKLCFSSIHAFHPGSFPDLDMFDAVVLHYSFFPGLHWQMPPELERQITKYDGLKILYVQDEYDHTDAIRSWIVKLGVRCMFSCVPAEYISLVYPPSQFPNTEFRQTLTGYVPIQAADIPRPPLSQRPNVIGYRGRVLHPRYGNLAREKFLIGERMREFCTARGIISDIELAEDKRIYGRRWYEFLASCRATLGTESGSNVFDEDGSLRARMDAALVADPDVPYDILHKKFIGDDEGRVSMNQVSPRVFEAIVMHTALILFEGRYSDVVSPWKHYLPLRKDFGNVDEIFAKLEDIPALEAMTKRAYTEVVGSGRYSYRSFVEDFDRYVETHATARGHALRGSSVAVPDGEDHRTFLRNSLYSVTDLPLKADWRDSRAACVRDLDRANSEFWDELCGSTLAQEIGIGNERSLADLEKFDQAYLGFYPYLLEHVPVGAMRGRTVLEVGLGYGTLGQQIAAAGAYYVGLDLAEGPVRMMSHRLHMQGLQGAATRGSMMDCPCRSESLDVVVSIGCFHHTGDVARCIDETYRVLKRGGSAFIMVYNLFSLRQWRASPKATLHAFVKEGFPGAIRSGDERQRGMYDANLSGVAAPETVFLSRRRLGSLFRRFTSVEIRSENDDPLIVCDRTVISREKMLRFGRFWGLDLYVSAQK